MEKRYNFYSSIIIPAHGIIHHTSVHESALMISTTKMMFNLHISFMQEFYTYRETFRKTLFKGGAI